MNVVQTFIEITTKASIVFMTYFYSKPFMLYALLLPNKKLRQFTYIFDSIQSEYIVCLKENNLEILRKKINSQL